MKACIALLVAHLFLSASASGGEISDYYSSIKSTLSADWDSLFLEVHPWWRYKLNGPWLFYRGEVGALGVIGSSGRGERVSIPRWAEETTDLAIQMLRWKNTFADRGIPEEVWRGHLNELEEYQLWRIETWRGSDRLENFNYDALLLGSDSWIESKLASAIVDYRSSLSAGDGEPHSYIVTPSGEKVIDPDCASGYFEEPCDYFWVTASGEEFRISVGESLRTVLGLSFRAFEDQHELMKHKASKKDLTKGEKLFFEMYRSSYKYVVEAGRESAIFLVWDSDFEEKGNGDFSIEIEIIPRNAEVSWISEFGYRVCRSLVGGEVTRIRDCDSAWQLGTGQLVYISGDYRYQIGFPDGSFGPIRATSFREIDVGYERKLVFTEFGLEVRE